MNVVRYYFISCRSQVFSLVWLSLLICKCSSQKGQDPIFSTFFYVYGTITFKHALAGVSFLLSSTKLNDEESSVPGQDPVDP